MAVIEKNVWESGGSKKGDRMMGVVLVFEDTLRVICRYVLQRSFMMNKKNENDMQCR